MTERWLPVSGWEGLYEVSDRGRVRSIRRSLILQPRPNTSGHFQVGFSVNDNEVMRQIHRLVLEAFVGPCPPGLECCHNDGDRTNNRLENLRWDTRSANQLDAVVHGGHVSPNSLKTHCKHNHEFTPENTYLDPVGSRHCRVCRREVDKKRRHKVAT